MKDVRVDLPRSLSSIDIELFSDLHIGSKECVYDAIYERRDRVLKNPNTYAILVGDLFNVATKNSKSDCYSEAMGITEQLAKGMEIFKPIADKILCITSGNHERRIRKESNLDMMWTLAHDLGLEDRYDYCACSLFLTLGEDGRRKGNKDLKNRRQVSYGFYIAHGDGQGGRTIGSKANGLERRGQIVSNVDVVITGHTHQAIVFREKCKWFDFQNKCTKEKEQLYVNTSSTLGYETYAELYSMKPSSIVSPVIHIDGTKKYAYATL